MKRQTYKNKLLKVKMKDKEDELTMYVSGKPVASINKRDFDKGDSEADNYHTK